jgi:hypothetical protein
LGRSHPIPIHAPTPPRDECPCQSARGLAAGLKRMEITGTGGLSGITIKGEVAQ